MRPQALFALAALSLLPLAAQGDKPAPLSAQTLKLPSGPTSLKGLGESFSANAANGSGSFSIPIELAPGILAPTVSLTYSGGHGRTEVGAGWRLSRFRIYRTTDKGLPRFQETDSFGVEGPGLNDKLVLVNPEARYYRLKNEGAFALFIRDAEADRWIVRLKNGDSAYLGERPQSRDANPRGSYRWYVEREDDPFGHSTAYDYATDRGRKYLQAIRYQLHAAPQAQNRVVFSYESRPDAFTDYTYGYAETTALRLQTLEVYHGERRLRRYSFGYQSSVSGSQLSSVDEEGESGLRKPRLTLGYVPFTNEGRLVTMTSPPPVDGLANNEATLEDVNGDGLPDLLVGVAGDYRYYENLDGVSWASSPRRMAKSPEVGLAEPGVVMLDADGDGFRDVLYSHYNSFRYASGGDIKDGVFKGYADPLELQPQGSWQFDWTSSQVKVSDLNYDGRIDLLMQRPGGLIQVINTEMGQLEESTLPALPVDVDFTDSRVQMLDFNGDGVLDFVRRDFSYQAGRIRVWHGRGWGEYLLDQEISGVPAADPSEVFLQDVNGDGQTDLVRVSGSWVVYHLNDGNGSLGPAKGDYRGLPATYQTRKLLFADMNGNGTTDVVWVTTDDRIVYLDLTSSPFYGQLERIDNGMGAVTTVTYRSSTEYLVEAKRAGKPWHTPLLRPLPVVSELRVSDSFAVLGLSSIDSATSYDYRDGFYDTREREFRGFGEVAVIAAGNEFHEAKTTRTWFSVGRNLATGEDEEILKGKPYRQVVTGADGRVLSSTETQWERRWLCQEDLGTSLQLLPRCSFVVDKQGAKDSMVALGVETGALEGAWEGTKEPRFSYTSFVHDPWGSTIDKMSHGEVAFAGGHAIGQAFDPGRLEKAIGHDEVESRAKFINNADPDRWLIGLGYQSEVFDLAGNLLKSSRTYFDGEAYQGLPLGQAETGKPSREEVWLKDEQGERWIAVKGSRYYADGQLAETRDARGSRREYDYDDETHSFLTLERLWTESGALDVTASYDKGYGVIVSAVEFNGERTQFIYDGLGRLTDIIGPLDTPDRPRQRYAYTYGTPQKPVSVTASEVLLDRAAGRYTRSWSYSDGLGRSRLEKSEAEAPHGFIGTGWQVFSAQGKPTHVFQAFASASKEFEPAPAMTPATVTYFDAEGRPLKVYEPQVGSAATYTATTYLPFETRVYDERDTSERNWRYPATSKTDGQGRVVELVKYNDFQGRFTELKWSVGYDALGNIASFVDPKANARQYQYDTLSRRRRVVDPNTGVMEFGYDDAGNLTLQTNALGERVTAEFGLQNRLLATRIWGAGAIAPARSYEFGYDVPGLGFPDARNLRGQLAWAADSVSKLYLSYDEQGRMVSQVREVWDPSRSPFDAQQRDIYRSDVVLNAQGAIVDNALPGGFGITYQYNERNLVSGVTAGFGGQRKPVASSLNYGALGERVRSDYANGTTTCEWFDARKRVIGLKGTATSPEVCASREADPKAFMHLDYRYTVDGLLEAIVDKAPVRTGVPRLDATYGYDKLYQLTSSKSAEGTIQYRYDEIQNLISQTATQEDTGLPLGSFQYAEGGAGPNAVTKAGRQTYAYDPAGRMQAYHGFKLRWDAQDRLLEATREDGTSIQNYYDYSGERVLEVVKRPGKPDDVHRYVFGAYQVHGQSSTWLVTAADKKVAEVVESTGLVPTLNQLDELVAYSLDGTRRPKPAAQELLDLDGNGKSVEAEDLEVAVRRYLGEAAAGPKVSVWKYLHSDHLESPTHVTDSSGDLVSVTRFHPYGRVYERQGETPESGFAGSQREPAAELGLIRMGARWYAPEIGRWASADKAMGADPARMVNKPLEANLFSYAANSPTLLVDSNGQEGEFGSFMRGFVKGFVETAPKAFVAGVIIGATVALAPAIGPALAVVGAAMAIKGAIDTVSACASGSAGECGEAIGGQVGGAVGGAAGGALGASAARMAKGMAKGVQLTPAKSCGCFVPGTLVDTEDGPVNIEDVALGDRVGPESEECAELDFSGWKEVDLEFRADSSEGGATEVNVRLLRPAQWLADNDVALGAAVGLELSELSTSGVAVVTGIADAPELKQGSRCPVTGLLRRPRWDVLKVSLEGGAQLDVTSRHRLYSAERMPDHKPLELERQQASKPQV
jgi:RHS repeat-associated protein